jgi:dUTP pyrophosphatase
MDRNRGFEKISYSRWTLDGFVMGLGENDVPLPTRKTRLSAGYDIPSTLDFILKPSQEIKFPLGFKVYMQSDEMFQIIPRSGSGFKYYTRLANTVGLIDSDYYNNHDNEGHCWCKIRNEGSVAWEVKKGDGIAQGIFSKYLIADKDYTSEVRSGGFGSTDKK